MIKYDVCDSLFKWMLDDMRCDDMFILMWINIATWALCQFWCAMMMFFLCRVCDVVLSSHIHCIGDEGFYAKRRGLSCQSDDGLLCRMSLIMDKSDGYHMHNIVVSHGVGYVYFWVFWRWVLFDGLWRIAMLYDTLFVMVFVFWT